jgi:hypothetical protein
MYEKPAYSSLSTSPANSANYYVFNFSKTPSGE